MVAPGENGIVRYAHLIRTRKYIAVISMNNRGGSYFSVTGWSTFIDRKEATPELIGENLKKSLQTSRDLFMEWGGLPLPQDKIDAEHKKSALVFADWECEQTDQVRLAASKGRGMGHSS